MACRSFATPPKIRILPVKCVGVWISQTVACVDVLVELLPCERVRLAVSRVPRTHVSVMHVVPPHLRPEGLQSVVRALQAMRLRLDSGAEHAAAVWRGLLPLQTPPRAGGRAWGGLLVCEAATDLHPAVHRWHGECKGGLSGLWKNGTVGNTSHNSYRHVSLWRRVFLGLAGTMPRMVRTL